jgi:hypothetical protein
VSEDADTTPAPRRRVSWRPTVAWAWAVGKWLVASAVATTTTIIAASDWVRDHVTETELNERLKPVDDNAKALLDRVLADEETRRVLAAQLEAARKDADRARRDLWWAWWWYTGDKAAELERDPRKRDRAANEARDRFEGYAREGMPLEEAYRRALRRGVP